MAAFEDRHWWYRGLRGLVVDSLGRRFPGSAPRRIVDVGCGTGGCYRAVRARFGESSYVGLDVEPRALEFCRARGLTRLIQASANEVPLRRESADAVICLDVLYYSSIRPSTALRRFYELLRPRGVLILNLPAFEVLRGEHDRAVGISKRFRWREVRSLCEQAGFRVVWHTYWNTTLFLPLMVWRWLSRARAGGPPVSDVGRVPRWLDGPCRWLILAEVWAARRVGLPFGSSLFVVAERPAAGPGAENPGEAWSDRTQR